MEPLRWLLVLGVCLSLGACKSEAAKDKAHPDHDAIEELKEKVANLKKIEKDAKKQDKLASSDLKLKKKGTYLCLFIDPPKNSHDYDASFSKTENRPSECSDEAAKRPGNADREKIDRCNDIRYVVAIKTRNLTKPEAADSKAFKPGFYEYDALVYDFESGKSKGGLVLKAENSDNVKARPGGEADDKLLTDLLTNACTDVEKALANAAK